jgi:hypothetical protein
MLKELLHAVISAESAEDYWAVQQLLLSALENRERIIRIKVGIPGK